MPNVHEADAQVPVPVVVHDAVETPVPPGGMSIEDVDLARQQASEMVREVRESSGSHQLAVIDDVTSVGLQSQRNAGRQLELVKTRLATLLDESGGSREVGSNLVDLRTALDRINPASKRAPGSDARSEPSPSCATTQWCVR